MEPIIDFGATPLANDFHAEGTGPRPSYPLRFGVCGECSLGLLLDVVDPDILYSNYAYVSSTSRTMSEHLDQLLSDLEWRVPGRRVLEIASNTGLFLQKFQLRGWEALGIEPARNIAEVANSAGVRTRCEYFDERTAAALAAEAAPFDLIVGRHVLAHIDDWAGLLAGLGHVSHRDTLIVFEVPYLGDLRREGAFDTIYHEHLSYVSAMAVERWLADSPFFLAHVEHYPIHGGSMVYHIRRRDWGGAADASVARARTTEQEHAQLRHPRSWIPFVEGVNGTRERLSALLARLQSKGRHIVGYGASARGNSLLAMCGCGHELRGIIDNTPFKQGLRAPGGLPVLTPEYLLAARPEHALILAWTFAAEIVNRELEYQRGGGRFIVPFPRMEIVGVPPSHALEV